MREITGILAPISTPFLAGEVCLPHLRDNVRKYSRSRLSGYFTLGSNGEGKLLTESEKLDCLSAILEEKAGHQLVLAGAGFESTRQTIAFGAKAAAAGADYLSIVTPSYYKKRMTDDALARYFMDVAESVPIPVLIYNAPGFTGITVSPALIEKISTHPNIAGMKDTSKGNMSGYINASGDDFTVLAGSISFLFTAMTLGAGGGVVSLANAFPDVCCDLFDACSADDLKTARRLHYLLYRLNRSVSGSFGVAGVKHAMDIAGFHGGDPRLPLLQLSSEDKNHILNAVKQAGLIS